MRKQFLSFTRRKFLQHVTAGAAVAMQPLPVLATTEYFNALKPANGNGTVFLFQGDSITDGNRGRNNDPNHIMGHGYAFSIASRVGADFPAAGYTFYNRGISGNKVPDLAGRWRADTIDLQPDVLSILVGINDAHAAVDSPATASSAAEFETGYRQLLQDARTARPATLFVLGIPFAYPVGSRAAIWPALNDAVMARAAMVKKLAAEFDAVLVDYSAVFNKAIEKAPAAYWVWDGIHPTVPGHELMAREWIQQASRRLPFLQHYI
jgi:lysophospholipase L1-like esterase